MCTSRKAMDFLGGSKGRCTKGGPKVDNRFVSFIQFTFLSLIDKPCMFLFGFVFGF